MMTTDWNNPQGDFDPVEKQVDLLVLLGGQQVTVHTCEEPDFDYMEDEDVAVDVKEAAIFHAGPIIRITSNNHILLS